MSSSKYGIVNKPIQTTVGKEKCNLVVGTLVNLQPPHSDSERTFQFTIKEYDLNDANEQHVLYNQIHKCPSHHIMMVNENVWPYVIPIPISERTNFLTDRKKIDFVMSLVENQNVSVEGSFFGYNTDYECIVKHIGCVDEMGKGIFFCLEILVSLIYINLFNNVTCYVQFLSPTR